MNQIGDLIICCDAHLFRKPFHIFRDAPEWKVRVVAGLRSVDAGLNLIEPLSFAASLFDVYYLPDCQALA
ncbi:hypothetical protein F9K91_04780 [Brucella tritici]|uniref:Uncharacterized protein n=1 Tax=Brucella tritici TaxID=94626 RepID=A0A6L3YL26_9HYPH|nr:hypothetical protein F9K91_04780 [Brucella tritici]KAB2683720.1 hypothetical protein F9L08_15080 [Brucella tritici]